MSIFIRTYEHHYQNTKWFPCPVCLKPLDVRMSKRNKPYVICSPCGVQMFIRERAGIDAFGKLVEQGLKADVLTRIGQLEQRYRLNAPRAKSPFGRDPDCLEGIGSIPKCQATAAQRRIVRESSRLERSRRAERSIG